MAVYKIANIKVKIEPRFERLLVNLPKYEINSNCYDAELKVDDDYYKRIEIAYPNLELAACEYMLIGTQFYEALLNFDGMLLHASAIEYNGKAYLFSAPSGTGKSTHAMMWKKLLGDEKISVINDDKPALKLENGKVMVYGTPFSGKTDLNENVCFELGGICFLTRSEENSIRRISVKEALPRVLEETHIPKDQLLSDKLYDLLDRMMPLIKFYSLKCNVSEQAVKTSFKAMTEDNTDD